MGAVGNTETKITHLYKLGEGMSGEITIPAIVAYNGLDFLYVKVSAGCRQK